MEEIIAYPFNKWATSITSLN